MKQTTHKNKRFIGIILTTIFAITMFSGFSQISFAAPTQEQSQGIINLTKQIDALYIKRDAGTVAEAEATNEEIAKLEKQLNLLKEEAASNDKYSLKDLKYNVSKELKLPGADQPKTYFTDTKYSPIVSFILSLINYATGIIGTIAMIIFIIAGFMLVIAQGDQTKIDKAKEVIKYAVIGLIITFLSYVITIFVQSLFITTTPAPTTPPATAQPK